MLTKCFFPIFNSFHHDLWPQFSVRKMSGEIFVPGLQIYLVKNLEAARGQKKLKIEIISRSDNENWDSRIVYLLSLKEHIHLFAF